MAGVRKAMRAVMILFTLLICALALFLWGSHAGFSVALLDADRGHPEPSVVISNLESGPIHVLCFAERLEGGQWIEEFYLDVDGDSPQYAGLMKEGVLRIPTGGRPRIAWSKTVWRDAPPRPGTYRIKACLVDASGSPLSWLPFLRWPTPEVYSCPVEVEGSVLR